MARGWGEKGEGGKGDLMEESSNGWDLRGAGEQEEQGPEVKEALSR